MIAGVGITLAAIKGLAEKLCEKESRIDELEAESDELRERLAAIEANVGMDTGRRGVTDD